MCVLDVVLSAREDHRNAKTVRESSFVVDAAMMSREIRHNKLAPSYLSNEESVLLQFEHLNVWSSIGLLLIGESPMHVLLGFLLPGWLRVLPVLGEGHSRIVLLAVFPCWYPTQPPTPCQEKGRKLKTVDLTPIFNSPIPPETGFTKALT
jgi:hypothetical protein